MSLASFFSRGVEIIEGIGHSAQSFLVKLFGAEAVQKVEADLSAIMHDDVAKIFTDAITAVETLQVDGTPATGEQQRAAAFTQIAKDLAADGKQLATNVINMGIELFVGLLHAKQPAAASTPATPPANPVPAPVSS